MPGAGGQAGRPVRPLSINPERAANQKRRLYERGEAFREIYRWRAGIEATMSHLKTPDEAGEAAHSRHVQHALCRQPARWASISAVPQALRREKRGKPAENGTNAFRWP
jgi:hypothetical protein